MKALPFHIPKTEQASLHTQVDRMPCFYDIFHRHPEFQLTYIIESRGTLILTGGMEDFEPGDFFIVGPNQPHVFKNDNEYYQGDPQLEAHAVSIFFDYHTFGSHFLQLPENHRLLQLLERSNGAARFKRDRAVGIGPLMLEILKRSPEMKLLGLLELLYRASHLEPTFSLGPAQKHTIANTEEDERISKIIAFTIQEFHRQITLEEVATLVNMTTTSFCRYFKKRTRKSYIDFLSEVRIRQACTSLTRSEMSINQICYSTGFNNLSNFNRTFKKITAMNPSTYKRVALNKE